MPSLPIALTTHVGVMRFLQIEWHNHERARNAWDIERAEMKAKIAKQEGDYRSARKLTEMLDKQVRMLEKALKHERSKSRGIAAGEEPPSEEVVRKEWHGKIGVPHTNKGLSIQCFIGLTVRASATIKLTPSQIRIGHRVRITITSATWMRSPILNLKHDEISHRPSYSNVSMSYRTFSNRPHTPQYLSNILP